MSTQQSEQFPHYRRKTVDNISDDDQSQPKDAHDAATPAIVVDNSHTMELTTHEESIVQHAKAQALSRLRRGDDDTKVNMANVCLIFL